MDKALDLMQLAFSKAVIQKVEARVFLYSDWLMTFYYDFHMGAYLANICPRLLYT